MEKEVKTMDEFYNASADETPVTIVYPTGSNWGGKFSEVQQTRTHYYGTKFTIDEVKELLLKEGFIQAENSSLKGKIDPATLNPYKPGVHEFAIVNDSDWGFGGRANEPREHFELMLYFKATDLYHQDCDKCTEGEDCFEDHNIGWDYEWNLTKLLNLNCDD